MAAIGYAILLAMLGTPAAALWTVVIGFGGGPGAMLTKLAMRGNAERQTPFWGLVLTVLGQAYVALAFVAFVLQTTQARLAGQSGFGVWIAWIVTFWVANAPAVFAWEHANKQQRGVQHEAIIFAAPLVAIGFFVFLFTPTVMHVGWRWVPHL